MSSIVNDGTEDLESWHDGGSDIYHLLRSVGWNRTRDRDLFSKYADWLPKYNICSICSNDWRCAEKNDHTAICKNAALKHSFGFKTDRARCVRIVRERSKKIKAFKLSFAKVAPSQIRITSTGRIVFTPLAEIVRKKNSKNGRKVVISKIPHYMKWCENCGNSFETVNEDRTLCDECSDEIVGRLGWYPRCTSICRCAADQQ